MVAFLIEVLRLSIGGHLIILLAAITILWINEEP